MRDPEIRFFCCFYQLRAPERTDRGGIGKARRLHSQTEPRSGGTNKTDLESLDPRGRTPLHLAVTLGYLDCARVLLQHGADVSKENRNGWTGECVCVMQRSAFVVTCTAYSKHRLYIAWCMGAG
uniref:Ankyrin repeat domain 13B n=1 Tax=Amphiprion percula TaxID=161767 RepID=A0A3P8U7W1_AMPPE